jgi:hypothetical protein
MTWVPSLLLAVILCVAGSHADARAVTFPVCKQGEKVPP